MKRNVKIILTLVIVGVTISCDKKENTAQDQIRKLLNSDINLSKENITNEINLIDGISTNTNMLVLSPMDDSQENIIEINETIDVDENTQKTEILTQVPVPIPMKEHSVPLVARIETNIPKAKVRAMPKKQKLYVVQQSAYIKIGTDVPNQIVGANSSKKITIAVFPRDKAVMVDIYIYAIPTYSHLVRNENTLIGYVKGVEFINNQAQFTRYWNGRRADGNYLKSGKYNIYIEYFYKNQRDREIFKDGRFWGGNHRNWSVDVMSANRTIK